MPQIPPYPADTAAKGWRFELDYEQIDRSSTWALAGAECRPWLLMQWMTAWRQVPCGSLPNDDEIIAALIGMPAELWEKHRKVLMRGWVDGNDGRLYHATVSVRVLEMLDYRSKQAKRVADFKIRQREQHAANALPTGEQNDSNDTGTGTGTGTLKDINTAPGKPVRATVHGFPPGFDEFWTAYPRKIAKPLAAKAFAKVHPDAELLARILSSVRQQASSEQWCNEGGRFVPHAATWLNGQRWLDEVSGETAVSNLFANVR